MIKWTTKKFKGWWTLMVNYNGGMKRSMGWWMGEVIRYEGLETRAKGWVIRNDEFWMRIMDEGLWMRDYGGGFMDEGLWMRDYGWGMKDGGDEGWLSSNSSQKVYPNVEAASIE